MVIGQCIVYCSAPAGTEPYLLPGSQVSRLGVVQFLSEPLIRRKRGIVDVRRWQQHAMVAMPTESST